MEQQAIVKLIEEALEARKKAYAPYSHFGVGAGLMTADGQIIRGCNIENASFGATNCAERTALFKAVSEGIKKFKAIAIVGGTIGEDPGEYAYPCGICRQALREFVEDDFVVIVAKSVTDYEVYRFAEVMPHGFKGESL